MASSTSLPAACGKLILVLSCAESCVVETGSSYGCLASLDVCGFTPFRVLYGVLFGRVCGRRPLTAQLLAWIALADVGGIKRFLLSLIGRFRTDDSVRSNVLVLERLPPTELLENPLE